VTTYPPADPDAEDPVALSAGKWPAPRAPGPRSPIDGASGDSPPRGQPPGPVGADRLAPGTGSVQLGGADGGCSRPLRICHPNVTPCPSSDLTSPTLS
jgi:hypothetical protein